MDAVVQPLGHVIEERPAAGRALVAEVGVLDQQPPADRVALEQEILLRLAAHLDDGADLGVELVDGGGEGVGLVDRIRADQVFDRAGCRSGDATQRLALAGRAENSLKEPP